MTKEEAVEKLKDEIKSAEYVDSDYVDGVPVDVLKTVIEILGKDINITATDCISRQAAIDVIEKTVCGDTWEVEQAINAVKDLPSAQPTIKPERKTGIWIERRLSGMVCSSCGYEYECKGTDSEDYCPHCGSYNGGEGNGFYRQTGGD